jgi:rhodanese-related sulfurtransferase
MSIPQTTPPEAHDILARNPDAIYLDVRTEEEFAAGHPAGARNVPVVFFDPATHRPRPNPDFVTVVARNLPRSTKLVVGCQAGGRSQHACELLVEAGFTDVTNVRGGFGGARDPSGRVVVPGWQDAGLPVETGASPGATYAELTTRR